jgi:hypothetical protein
LVNFECGRNKVERLPQLGSLPNLVKVDLSYNAISQAPSFDSSSKLERLLLNDNNITHPVQELLSAMGPRHPSLRILSLSNNPLGGSLSTDEMVMADLGNERPTLAAMPKLESLGLARVQMHGEMYEALLDGLWTSLTFLDVSGNEGITSLPLRQSGGGRQLVVYARDCPGLAHFLSVQVSRFPESTRSVSSRHAECDDAVLAGTLTVKFPIYVSADMMFGSASGFCTCLDDYFQSESGDCVPCDRVSSLLKDRLSAVACRKGVIQARGAWLFEQNGTARAVSCPRGVSSSPCQVANMSSAVCAAGYEGRVCSKCSPGWFRSGRSCVLCQHSRWAIHPILSLGSFLLIAKSGNPVLAILVLHCQLLTSIARVLPTPPPDITQQPLAWLLSLSAFTLEGVECAGGDRIDQFNGPLLAACLLPFFCLVPSAAVAAAAPRGERLGRLLAGWSETFFLGLFVAAKTVFGVLACTDGFGPRGQMFVSDFLWLECPVRSGPYRISYGLAFTFLSLFVLITALVMGVLLSRPGQGGVLAALVERAREPFVDGLLWWERVRVLRRWSLAAVHGLSAFASPVITFGTITILTTSILLQVAYKPFRENIANMIELGSLVTLFATFVSWHLISAVDTPHKWIVAIILAANALFLSGSVSWAFFKIVIKKPIV